MMADHSVTNLAPVFIGGAPRSGTTLVLRILGRHPEIETYCETKIVFSFLSCMEGTMLCRANPCGFRLHEYFARDDNYRMSRRDETPAEVTADKTATSYRYPLIDAHYHASEVGAGTA
jgi:Sulfotransferase family